MSVSAVSLHGDDGELLTVEEAAAILKVRPSTLRFWAREGHVPCIRLGPRATRWTRPLLGSRLSPVTERSSENAAHARACAGWCRVSVSAVSLHGDDGELLTVEEAAAILKVRPSTLRFWAREGHVPCIRLGPRATRWTRPLLREIVASRTDAGRVI